MSNQTRRKQQFYKKHYHLQTYQNFLGLCTHLSRFVRKFSAKTALLRALLKRNEKFIWTKEQDSAFENLKQDLTDESMLAFYDPNEKCILVTDACNESTGGILLQVNNNNKENL